MYLQGRIVAVFIPTQAYYKVHKINGFDYFSHSF